MSTAEFTVDALQRAQEMTSDQLGVMMPLVDLSGGVMIFKDGSMSVGFSCRAPMCSLLPEETRSMVFDGLRTALRTLPPNANLQFYFGQESRAADVEPLLDPGHASSPLARRAIAERGKQFVDRIAKGQLRATTLDVFINLPSLVKPSELRRRMQQLNAKTLMGTAPADDTSPLKKVAHALKTLDAQMQSLLNPLSGAVVLTLSEYQEERAALLSAAESLNACLAQAGLKPTPMQSADVLRRLYRKNNPEKYEAGLNAHAYNPDSTVPIAEHYLSSTLDLRKELTGHGMFRLDGYYYRILTLRMPAEKLTFPHFEPLGLFGGLHRMDIVVNLVATDPRKRIDDLQAEKTAILANDKANSGSVKVAQIEREISELGSGEDRLWQAQHIFILRDRDPEAVKRQALTLMTLAQRADAAEVSEEDVALLPYWRASQPGWARDRDLNRHNIYTTPQLVASLPCFSGDRLDPLRKIGGVFETVDGSLYSLFPHDTQEFSSPNLLILGKAGSGKGVTANSVCVQLLRYNPRFIIIDIGSSYKRFCESVGGAFQEYDIRSEECRINPFDIFTGRTADPEEVQGVLLQLGKMVADARNPEIGNPERAAFEEALLTLIRRQAGKPFYMREYRDVLQGLAGNRVAADLAVRLAPFVTGGSYARLFDGFTKAPTGARTTVFELQRLKHTSPELLPVVFQTIIQHVISLATKYPEEMKFLLMDEAHVLLADPVLRKFVELAYRTFRKLGVAVIGISQGIDEWLLEGNPRAIVGNVSGILACSQSPASIEALTKVYNLSPNEQANLSGLQVSPGSYNQFMAMRFTSEGRRASVCVNRLTPIEYAMFTTHALDVAVINRWTAEPFSMTLTAAVEKFAAKYPRGVELAGGPAPEDRAAA